MSNPYKNLPENAFWSPAVGHRHALDIDDLWTAKWPISPGHKIATFGSCFAQHFGRALSARGFTWMASEMPPADLSEDRAMALNFGVFTARTGNIYTVSLLNQWVRWALGEPSPQDEIWEKEGRFYDPFRPAIEPGGFDSQDEMLASRELTIEAFSRAIRTSDVFVFTLGLTESWWNTEQGYEYPMCPGTVAGTFSPERHEFRNQDYPFISRQLMQAIRAIQAVNPKVRFLLTVSPVPLTATNAGNHVLVATTYSKSVLRAVAGRIADQFGFADYFPSYEIISSPPYGGQFYEMNKRGVRANGVDHVMAQFFSGLYKVYPTFAVQAAKRVIAQSSRGQSLNPLHSATAASKPNGVAEPTSARGRKSPAGNATGVQNADAGDLVCEEEMLAAFGPSDIKQGA